MDLGNSIANLGNKNTLLTSVITKVLQDVFLLEKSIDVSSYINSVQVLEQVVIVKTGNPMINAELFLLSDKIEESCKDSLHNM